VVGRLYQQFALTIAFSVLISAFNALTLTPALCALILKPRTEKKPGLLKKFFDAFNVMFEKFTNGYVKLSEIFVHRWIKSLLFLLILTLGLVFLLLRIPKGFIPIEDQGYFFINAQLPDAASLQRSDELLKKVEDILARTPGVQGRTTVGGFSMLTHTSASYYGFMFVNLTHWDERKDPSMHANEIINRINIEFQKLPEAVVFAFPPPGIPGLGTTGGLDFMLQDRSGGDVDYLQKNLDRFMAEIRKRPEIASVSTMFRSDVPQVYADVDRDKVTKMGADIRDVYAALQTYLGGYYINDFNKYGRQWKVFMEAEPESRTSVDKIGQFYVRNQTGDMIPLSTMVNMKTHHGPEYTMRYNLFRSAEILANPAPGYSTGQAIEAMEQTATQTMPFGMGFDWTGMTLQEKRSAGTSTPIFILAVVFVFLILAALYESWSLPFSVLLGTPIAVFGAIVGLMGRFSPFDIFAQIGVVMLVGLAAKNSLLRVQFSKAALDEGMLPLQAALAGGERRLRPIIMTALAFILGCVPLWTATGAGAMQRRSLGTTVISGMATSTVVEIFLVPVLFFVVETISHKLKGHPNVSNLLPAEKLGIQKTLEQLEAGKEGKDGFQGGADK
ncbi:MAG: efflux RND transporter permease subunit, partial [Myxococcota bacterium]|jgi:HAE1 family hydrophobic/amphiphilic exporter-1